MEAHARQADRHSLKARFDHAATSVSSMDQICWGRRPVTSLEFLGPLEAAGSVLASFPDEREYVDCHAWHFTPSSFELLVLELTALGMSSLAVREAHPTQGCEFYITLECATDTTEDNLDLRRLELHRKTLIEVREQADLLLGEQTKDSSTSRRVRRLGRRVRRLRGGVRALVRRR